jgi:hypothetical protein
MGFFNSNKTIEDNPDVKDLRANIARLEASNSKLLTHIDTQQQAIESYAEVQSEYETKLKAQASTHIKEIEKLKVAFETEKQSVNRKVMKALANIGVSEFAPEEIVAPDRTMNASDVYEKWKTLQGYEKGRYFKENELTIRAFQKDNFKQ